jgi:hypothetical protein
MNPLADDPSDADCLQVTRYGFWGLLACGVRHTLARHPIAVQRALFGLAWAVIVGFGTVIVLNP